jgi:hypothetical protein
VKSRIDGVKLDAETRSRGALAGWRNSEVLRAGELSPTRDALMLPLVDPARALCATC